jgi:hypothetical protein
LGIGEGRKNLEQLQAGIVKIGAVLALEKTLGLTGGIPPSMKCSFNHFIAFPQGESDEKV